MEVQRTNQGLSCMIYIHILLYKFYFKLENEIESKQLFFTLRSAVDIATYYLTDYLMYVAHEGLHNAGTEI